jgi:nitrite reductase/ring-hydroxylating ferredoxin subunit
MGEFVRIAATDEVKPGQGMVAEVNGKSLAVFNVDGQFHVIDNTCVHRGGPLGEGELDAHVVTCPWHGWQFNVLTGACVNNPSAKVECYEVKVEGADLKALL